MSIPNVSILLPSKQKRYLLKYLTDIKLPADEILVFNAGMHQITSVMNRMIDNAKYDYIILIDPKERDFDINEIRKSLPYCEKANGIICFSKNDFNSVQVNCLSHKQFHKEVLKNFPDYKDCIENIEPVNYEKISIIIPFMYNGDRMDLFDACIENLHNLIKTDKTIELVIHETGSIQHLTSDWIDKYNVKYAFTKWNDVFHRGWSLNYATKHIATGDLFVFMDADLIVDRTWLESIKTVTGVAIGWSEMVNLNNKGTKKFFDKGISKITKFDIERIRKPNVYAAAGGINIYPKKVFYDIKGWCEDYYGTYGGEDNSTFLKLQNFNIPVSTIKAKVYHLHHTHNTYKNPRRFEIFNKHKKFTKNKWKKYVKNIKSWGDQIFKIPMSERKLKILWLKIDTSKRVAGHYDDLPTELTKHCHIDVLTQSLQGLHPAMFQQKCLANEIKRDQIVRDHLEINNDYDFIICANLFAFNNENWDRIDIPKAMLFEDQHGENNLKQIQDAIKHQWIVLHRYQFNKFHKDTKKYTKCIWFPHSVNINTFRDYKQRKKYDILQTGAVYKVYETRNFINNQFKDDPRFHQIPRPKENIEEPWPVGREYAKELNKAQLVVCCGSIYEYPVMKYFEIPASKSIIFGDWFPELGELGFKPYENMIVADKSNIKFQTKLLFDSPHRLKRIASAGFNLIQQRHTNTIRAKELIKIIKENI